MLHQCLLIRAPIAFVQQSRTPDCQRQPIEGSENTTCLKPHGGALLSLEMSLSEGPGCSCAGLQVHGPGGRVEAAVGSGHAPLPGAQPRQHQPAAGGQVPAGLLQVPRPVRALLQGLARRRGCAISNRQPGVWFPAVRTGEQQLGNMVHQRNDACSSARSKCSDKIKCLTQTPGHAIFACLTAMPKGPCQRHRIFCCQMCLPISQGPLLVACAKLCSQCLQIHTLQFITSQGALHCATS